MTVAPNSFGANTVACALLMLSQSATAQALVGAANAAACQAFIINRYGGNPSTAGGKGQTVNMLGNAIARPASYFLVDAEDFEDEQVAFNEYKHSGVIRIVPTIAITTGDTAPDMMTRGRNILEQIKADLYAQRGATGCLMSFHINSHGPSLPDITGAHKGTMDGLLEIFWKDVI